MNSMELSQCTLIYKLNVLILNSIEQKLNENVEKKF